MIEHRPKVLHAVYIPSLGICKVYNLLAPYHARKRG